MIYFTLDDVIKWQRTQQQPLDYDIIAVINTEFLHACEHVPTANEQELVCYQLCREIFKHKDWSSTFRARPQVLFMEEVVPACHLTALQWYFCTQSLDIDKIHVVAPTHLNSRSWWHDWCHQARQTGYHLHDFSPGGNLYFRQHHDQGNVNNWDQAWKTKLSAVDSTFSLFGGAYSHPDRCYVTLCFSDVAFRSHAWIDMHGSVCSRDDFEAYCERITGFTNDQHVKDMMAIYDRNVSNDQYITTYSVQDFPFEYDWTVGTERSVAWQINQRCWFNITRETFNDHCFATVSEKTLRAFCHFCVPIPLGLGAAEELKRWGFWLPEDLIDYSYQAHHGFYHRVQGAKQQVSRYLGQDLTDFWQQNQNKFLYNAQLAWDMAHGNNQARLNLS